MITILDPAIIEDTAEDTVSGVLVAEARLKSRPRSRMRSSILPWTIVMDIAIASEATTRFEVTILNVLSLSG